jgi:hypothetical protein
MSLTAPPATHCERCGAALAADQRYCLDCGAATAAAHAPPARTVAAAAAPPPPPPAPASGGSGHDWTPVWALGGLLVLALVLIVGVLIGRSGAGDDKAATPQVIRVAGGAGASTAGTVSDTGSAVKTDWPAGTPGFTVELGRIAKAGASAAKVDAARAQAKGKGAPGVGVLDSDRYSTLPGGDWVVYSGVFTSKQKAAAALKKLRKSFPDARVVEVGKRGGSNARRAASSKAATASGGDAKKAINDLNSSGSAYEKQLKKKPKTIVVPGKAPPKDNKAPGGGSGSQEIG